MDTTSGKAPMPKEHSEILNKLQESARKLAKVRRLKAMHKAAADFWGLVLEKLIERRNSLTAPQKKEEEARP